MATKLHPAKLALLALLEAVTWPGANQPEVRYGQPTEGEDAPFRGEMIFLGESRAASDQVGPQRRDETFNLRLVVDVRSEGDDEQSTEARAWELANAAEAAVWADHPNPLGGNLNRIPRIEMTQVNVPEPQAWRTQIVVDVECVSALTNA
jgi:hypothetical protein